MPNHTINGIKLFLDKTSLILDYYIKLYYIIYYYIKIMSWQKKFNSALLSVEYKWIEAQLSFKRLWGARFVCSNVNQFFLDSQRTIYSSSSAIPLILEISHRTKLTLFLLYWYEDSRNLFHLLEVKYFNGSRLITHISKFFRICILESAKYFFKLENSKWFKTYIFITSRTPVIYKLVPVKLGF